MSVLVNMISDTLPPFFFVDIVPETPVEQGVPEPDGVG